MRIPYTDKTLFGAHVGEHGFVESAVLDEIKDYVKKGLNFVTIRPPYERKVDEKYYYEWAKYLADNHVYFIFIYALQYPPKGQVSHLTPEICARVKEIGDGEVVLVDKNGEQKTISCDSVIMSVGYNPAPVAKKGKNVHVIGDADKVGNLRTVIWGAWDVAMKL